MGVLEKLETRVTALEKDRDEHRKAHERVDRKLDGLASNMADVKTRLGGVEDRLGRVEANTADLGEIRARVALIPELQAGQIEIRDMVATLLARSEQGKGS
jgi:predicted  nucleic acid-binding Zn-ribbon protein